MVLYAMQLQPLWFIDTFLGAFAWSKQREVIESVRDNQRTAVRSAHGLGKTRLAAYAVLWFLNAYPNSKVITTAPTWNQVEKQLWREIRAVYNKAQVPLGGKLLQTELSMDDEWFAMGLSTDEPERFSGYHAENILVVFDEASGVSEEIYEAAEGYLTTHGGRMLLIGNPTQVSGQFYQAFHRERALWKCIHISVFDSPNFTDEDVPDSVKARLTTPAWVEDKKVKWGEGTPMYDVRVLGNFPSQSDNTVFSLSSVETAQANEIKHMRMIDPVVVACDVARFGSDETVISVRQGDRIRLAAIYVGKDTQDTAGRVIAQAKKYAQRTEFFPQIVIDDDGVGGGVTDAIRAQGFMVNPFRGGAKAIDSQEYVNAKSELWFQAAERITECDLDDDEQLAADLTCVQYKFDSRGRRVIEPKADVKKRLGRSPDRADSVLLTFAPERGGDVETITYADQYEEPIYAKGDLVLVGDKYIDQAPEEW